MGTVYVATDTALHRTVAIKILKPEYASDVAFRTRFETEAKHAAGLDHPGIAKVYDFGETSTDGTPRPYLVMEYVDGQPLSALLAAGRPLEQDRVVDLIAQTAEALQAAHDKQIVHRDVKPANLLITPQAQVKVTDFGIAKAASDTPITTTGTIIGTAHYLPPEQAEGKPATVRSDIYALGVVLYECLSGVRPFVGDNPVAIAIAHVREQPPPLPDTVSPWLTALTMRMLAKDPAARPGSAGELAKELRAGGAIGAGDPRTSLLGAGATLAPTNDTSHTQVMAPAGESSPEPEPGPQDSRRRRMIIAAAVVGGLVLLALLIVGAVALWGGDDDGSNSPGDQPPTAEGKDRPTEGDGPNNDPTEPDNDQPTEPDNDDPTEPTSEPSSEPTTDPTSDPTTDPTSDPTTDPTTSDPTTASPTTPTTESTTSRDPSSPTSPTDEEDATTP
jgi:eukaryotic-like serine/threonine-protein kinase